MHSFQPLPAETIEFDPFTSIGKDWALVSAERDGKVNTMTIAWGGVGVLWNRNVAMVFIRDSRYTKEFIDHADGFSVTFFSGKEKNALQYLGRVSGRTEDKIKNTGFTVDYADGIPYIDEGNFVLVCRKIAVTRLEDDSFLDPEIKTQFYKDEDYHNLYIGEIVEFLGR